MRKVNVICLKDFYNGYLGGNYICNGKASGEEFFESMFKDFIKSVGDDYIIIDGSRTSYTLPFINTLIRLSIEVFGVKFVEDKIRFVDTSDLNKENSYNGCMQNIIVSYKYRRKGYKHPDNLKHCIRYKSDKNRKTYE